MKVYVAKSNKLEDRTRNRGLELLLYKFGPNLTMHNGGKYDESKVANTDILILIDNPQYSQYVGRGVYSEIKTILSSGRRAFLLKENRCHTIDDVVLYNVKDWTYRHAKLKIGFGQNFEDLTIGSFGIEGEPKMDLIIDPDEDVPKKGPGNTKDIGLIL